MEIVLSHMDVLKTVRFSNMDLLFKENNVLHYIFKENVLITMEDAFEVMQYLNTHHAGEKFYNIFEGGEFTDIDSEVRTWAAKNGDSNYTIADAIVVKSMPQRIVAKFYIKFDKPKVPTKIFANVEVAEKWLLSLRDRIAS